MVSNFFITYFGWEPSIASVIWAILIAVAIRFFVWVRTSGWLDHEKAYWIGTPIGCLILLAALSYAARGGKSLKPDFRVQIAQMTAGVPTDNKTATSMILGLYLFNNGQPSVALHYQLSASVPGAFTDKMGEAMTLPESLPFSDPKTGQVQTFLGTDALYTKTLRPIVTGGVESGILWYIFSDADSQLFDHNDASFKLVFEDSLGESHTVQFTRADFTLPGFHYQPGLESYCPAPTPLASPLAPFDIQPH